MRKVIGYIRDLVDGTGPEPRTVTVNATTPHSVNGAGGPELDEAANDLGKLTVEHLADSGDKNLADKDGRFGWSFELSPGPIDVFVNPTDPVEEKRWRYPDESSQVGLGFHSDIGRLGWAAGADCVVWNAIPTNDPSPAAWNFDPNSTWNVGNGSIAFFGGDGVPAHGPAGTVTIRPFIGFLGGALFSVEGGDLQVPVGGPPATANASSLPRWDLLQLVLNTDTSSLEYGKQTIQIQEGAPGGGIPPTPNPTVSERRLTLHAMLMPAGGGGYTQGYDLRPFNGPFTSLTPAVTSNISYMTDAFQEINHNDTNIASLLNTGLASNALRLAPSVAYSGMAIWTGEVRSRNFDRYIERLTVDLTSEAIDAQGAVVLSTNYVVKPYPDGHYVAVFQQNEKKDYLQTATLCWPISLIPAFYAGTSVNQASRTWSRLRFKVNFSYTGSPHEGGADFRVLRQSLLCNLWPVG